LIVKDIMNKGIQRIDASATVKEAAKKMRDEEVGCLLVVEDSKLYGIITEDDIITKVVVEGRSPQTTRVDDIMVKEVVHITSEKSIEDAAELMTGKKIKKLPVVDDHKLVGIVTATDMVAAEPRMMDQLAELFLLAKRPQKIAG